MLSAPAPITGAAGRGIIPQAKHRRRGLALQVLPPGFGEPVSPQRCWGQEWLYRAGGAGHQSDAVCLLPRSWAGVFLPAASIRGNHGNQWRCSAHAEGGSAAPWGSPSTLSPGHPWPAGAPSGACRVRVASIGRRGSRGERQLPWPCRNIPAQRGWKSPRVPLAPQPQQWGSLRDFLARSSPQHTCRGAPVLLLCLQLEFPWPKAAG